MHILLVQPPLTTAAEVQPPLGLCVLAAHLLTAGHAVSILDLDLKEDPIGQAPDRYLERFEATVREKRPQVVGVTSMFNNSLHGERLIGAAKRLNPDVITMAGGSHFGALPQESLARIAALDYVIRGEGEAALCYLLSALEHQTPLDHVQGLCYRSSSGIVQNPAGPLLNLKSIPPTWACLKDVLDLGNYAATIPTESARKSIYIEAGRGCPFACSFCATAPFWDRRYRVKSIDTIILEMCFLHEQSGYNMFMLVHDLLTADRRFVSEFCDALFAAELPVEWTANHRADIELGALAPKMRSAGCLSVFMGTESASDRVQKEMQKGLTRDHTLSTVRSLLNSGISSTCSFIIGFPSETAADVSATLAFAAQLKMIGAEPVQVHRLRRWPPAPLAALDLPSSFDLEALRIEYPFDNIPEPDIETMRGDRAFFIGYFTPSTLAGSSYELAQLELLFANLLAEFPITTGVLAKVHGDQLVSAYYRALARQGPISRATLHSPLDVRDTLVPYLSEWIAHDMTLADWQATLLAAALSYERIRIGFMLHAKDSSADAIATGPNWIAFTTAVDIVGLLRCLGEDLILTPAFCQHGYVVMTQDDQGAVRGFAFGDRSMERLRRHDPELLNIFENREVA